MTIDAHQQEDFFSYCGMIKKNDGLFKSLKQSNFFWDNKLTDMRDGENTQKYYGFPLEDNQRTILVGGTSRHANHGSRSLVPYLIAFVFDKFGIVARYKIGGNGNLRDGWAPNPKKCKAVWERPADLELPQWEEPVEVEIDPDSMVPVTPKRVKVCGTVLSFKESYGEWGTSLKMRIKDDRGFILYGTVPASVEGELEEGDKLEFMCKIIASLDDPLFGFYSRPTKAKKL